MSKEGSLLGLDENGGAENRNLCAGMRFAIPGLLNLAAAIALSAAPTFAQTQPDDTGITPLGMAHGSPAGSYALSDFDNVNVFSGSLSIHLPLLRIGGRGLAGMTVYLVREQHWGLKQNNDAFPKVFARYNWFRGLRSGYGPGAMRMYRDTNEIGQKLTRLTFTFSDQTQYEFRDVGTDGGVRNPVYNRGRVFWTRDGSAATFVSDTDITDGTPLTTLSGHLHLRDGTTYRIDGGLVAWIRDRNGNNTTFAYESTPHDATIGVQVIAIADSLGRQVDFTYDTTNGRDIISFSGFGGASRTIIVRYTPLSDVTTGSLPPACGGPPCRHAELFPELNWGLPFATGGTQEFFNPLVVSGIDLPNGQAYGFTYNAYGEVAGLTLPTGGSFGYSYQAGRPGINADGVDGNTIYRRLAQKTVNDGTSIVAKTNFGQQNDTPSGQSILVEHFDASNGDARIAREVHFHYGRARDSLIISPTDYPNWQHGKEYRTESQSGDATLLRVVEHTWEQKDQSTASYEVDPRIVRTATTLADVAPNLVSYQHFAYDTYNNPTATAELDFGQGPLGNFSGCASATTFLRCRETLYLTPYAVDTSVHIRDLPSEERTYEVTGGAPTMKGRTIYEYDIYVSNANHAPLVNRPGIIHLDSGFTLAYATRGNVTGVLRCKDVPGCGGVASRYLQYDVAGNVVKRINPRGYATTVAYDDNFGSPDGSIADVGAFPPTFALPTIAVNWLSHATRTQFDYWTGQVVDQQDPNGVVSTAWYGQGDNLDRLTKVARAYSDPATRTQARFVYDNVNRRIQTFRDLLTFNDTTPSREDLIYDGLGRNIKVRNFETSSDYIEVRTSYDAIGRERTKSNPFRAASEGVVYTTTDYDALGRVVQLKTPDDAVVQTTFAGNQTTVTDPANKVRKMTTDVLGRLKTVVEDPNGRNYTSSYLYDAFDHVVQVNQGGQTRSFSYDPLQRLILATNPESGQTSFAYDDNSNLIQKRDGRALSAGTTGISYVYDPIDRIQSKSYGFPSGVAVTPSVTYTYDASAVPNSIGRLTRISSTSSTMDVLAYDPLGRVTSSRQTTSGTPYSFVYTYDRGGNLRTQTYPSGRTITIPYDLLNRPASVSDNSRAYADNLKYSSHGAMNQVRLGNGRWEKVVFNSRLQPSLIALGSAQGATDLLSLGYGYVGPSSTTNNNGNILSQTITVSGVSLTQTYGYDGLSRLTSASEIPSAGSAWSQIYDNDAYGNHWVSASTGYSLSSLTPTSNSAFSASTNRLLASGYDIAGNQTSDVLGRTFTYDGENRLTTGPGAGSYAYDGEGHRVSRTLAGNTTVFVYDVIGRLCAEYGGAAAAPGVNYVTQDHLGSTRVVTDATGAVIGRHDFLPFGEEIPISLGNRSAIVGYGGADTIRQRYTGKERDAESALDYYGARFASAAGARWMSVDLGKPHPPDPQSWIRYSYALNNPLRYVDPDGNDPRQALGALGEKLLVWHLNRRGYTVVLDPARKAVNAAGFDAVAIKTINGVRRTFAIDNKAFTTRTGVSDASALVGERLAENTKSAIAELQAGLRSKGLSAAERNAIEAAIEGLETGTFNRVVTGFGGVASRVTARLAAEGVSFSTFGKAVGKTLGSAVSAGLFVATEGYFADPAGGPEADLHLSGEEEQWLAEYRAQGLDIEDMFRGLPY